MHLRSEAVGYGKVIDTAEDAAAEMARVLPTTSFGTPLTQVFDFADRDFTTAALQEILVHLGQGLRGGLYPDLRVVFVTANPALSEFVSLVARANGFPFYVAASKQEIPAARPVGELTASEEQTLEQLHQLGGRVTAAEFAQAIGMAATAANNRLSALDRKGYLVRVRRHRRLGDQFIDPRASLPSMAELRERAIRPMGSALRSAGISTDLYAAGTTVLDGEGAERAAEILRRRAAAT